MKEIKLTQGKVALVDDDDFYALSRNKWYFNGREPVRRLYLGYDPIRKQSRTKIQRMSRQVIHIPAGKFPDHINGNKLDNRKSNLRICGHRQNCLNRGPRKDSRSGYKGVSWDVRTKKWAARITLNGKTEYIGFYGTIPEAAWAYNKRAKVLHGEFARMNTL